MAQKRKIIYSSIIAFGFLISLLLGVVYNLSLNEFNHFNFSSRYFFFVPILSLLGIEMYFVVRMIEHYSCNNKNKKSKILFLASAATIVLLVVMWYLQTRYLGSVLTNAFVITFILPVIIYIIGETKKYKYGFIAIIFEVITATLLIGTVCEAKFALYTLVILNIIAINTYLKNNANKRNKQCFAVLLIGVSIILLFIMFSLSPGLIERQYEFCHQNGIIEYDAIKKVIHNANIIDFNLNTAFLDEVNTVYGCGYTHLLSMFGWLPVALFAIIQLASVIIMGVYSAHNSKNEFYKKMLWLCTGTVAFQLFAGLASSFLLMPISEFGILFVTICGLETGIVPTILFLILMFDKYSDEKDKSKPIKIVLAGGPCSGKTSVIKGLKKCINPKYVQNVKFIDEVASSVLSESRFSNENRLTFQETIFSRQSMEEEELDSNIKFVITDRGKADAYVYLSDDEIKSVDGLGDLNQVLSEYDAVIFFEKSDNSYLKKDDDTIRVENNAEETENVTARTKKVWMQHNNVIVIQPFPSVDEKAEYVAMQINKICKNNVFKCNFN